MQQPHLFREKHLAYVLIFPQIFITLVFFIWPSANALFESFFQDDAFGLKRSFVWFENYIAIFSDPYYLHSVKVTIIFSASVCLLSMGLGLIFAQMANQVTRFASIYKTLLILPYAVAPAVAGILWLFLFLPHFGIICTFLDYCSIEWDPLVNGNQAMLLIILAASWKQISYNFIFFLAGLQSIPKSIIDAANLDGAGPIKRFWTIIFPLLSPTTFFLIIVNCVYAFFDTFGIIHTVTSGGPAKATETLVYKVWYDGFQANAFGSSAAQSVVLMLFVVGLIFIQFRYVEKKVHY